MRKEKYRYNLKTLQYERIQTDWTTRLLRILGFLAASVMTGLLIFAAVTRFYDSPKEKLLKEEISRLKSDYVQLEKELDNASEILSSLRERDINTYRVIFEAEPIPETVWEAGTGGVNKYKDLEKYTNGALMKRAHEKIDKLNRQLYLQSRSYDEINDLIQRKEDMLASIPAIQPVANVDLKRMASGYGMRIDPVYGVPRMHNGMDFTAPTGTEIYATGKGKAVTVNYSTGGYGNRIIIDHGYGYRTLYAHMSAFAIEQGDSVQRGQVIGYVGNTGKSVGPHLHYEVRKNGVPVNPVYFYYQDLDDESFATMIEMSANTGQALD